VIFEPPRQPWVNPSGGSGGFGRDELALVSLKKIKKLTWRECKKAVIIEGG